MKSGIGNIGHVLMVNMWLSVGVLLVAAVAAAYLRFGTAAAVLGSAASIMLMIRSEGQQPSPVAADDRG